MKKYIAVLSLLVLLTSCHNKNKLVLVSSTGRINSVLVVVKNSQWAGVIGDTLKTIFKTPVEGLPQPEPQFRVSQIGPNNFATLFENSRNILAIGIGSENIYNITTDKYASPQIIMTIMGKNQSELINQIKLHQKDIINVFKDGDLKLYQKKLSESVWPQHQFKFLKNLSMVLPKDYLKVVDKPNFLWLRKHLEKDAAINFMCYTMPMMPEDSITLANLVEKRNEIAKQHVPGESDNTYMQTADELEPTFKTLQVKGMKAYEIRGLWDVKNDFMGGPFINYTFVDTAHNRLICLDGFVYHPNQDKRDDIFELEAIFRSLNLN